MVSGQLDVTVLGARGLRDLRSLGKMDPYASLVIGSRKYRTKANESGGINPVWSEHFAFAVGPGDRSMTVTVFDTARMGSDAEVGECVIQLAGVLASGRDDSRHSLEHKNKVVGELSLILIFTPDAHGAAAAAPAAPVAAAAMVPVGTAVAGSAAKFAGMASLPVPPAGVAEAVLPGFAAAPVTQALAGMSLAPQQKALPGMTALPGAAAPAAAAPQKTLPGMTALPTAPPAPAPAPPPPAPYVPPPPPPPQYAAPPAAVAGYGAPPPVGYGAAPPAVYGEAPRASLPGAVGYSTAPQPQGWGQPAPYGGPVQGYAPAVQVPHHSSVPSGVMNIYPGTPTVPFLLLDTTGSMNFPCSAATPMPRRELVRDALGALVAAIEQRQGQGATGLRTVAFSGGAALDLGYLSSYDFGQQWQRLSWVGGTYIAPAWQLAYGTFASETGGAACALLAVLLTDGEAADLATFEAGLNADPRVHVLVALVGFGAEHDASFASFMALAARNPRVHLVSFTGEQNARAIGDTLARIVLFG